MPHAARAALARYPLTPGSARAICSEGWLVQERTTGRPGASGVRAGVTAARERAHACTAALGRRAFRRAALGAALRHPAGVGPTARDETRLATRRPGRALLHRRLADLAQKAASGTIVGDAGRAF